MSQAKHEEQRQREQVEKDRAAEVERKNSAQIARDEENQRERTDAIVKGQAPAPDQTLMTKAQRDALARTNAEQGILVNPEQQQAYRAEQDRLRRIEQERLALARREKVMVRKGADWIPSDRGLEELINIHGPQNVKIGDVLVQDIENKDTGEDKVRKKRLSEEEKARDKQVDHAAKERERRRKEDEDLMLRDEVDKPLISQNGLQVKSLGGFEDKVRLAENTDKRPVNVNVLAGNRQQGLQDDTPQGASAMAQKAVGETRGDILAREREDKQEAQDRKNDELAKRAENRPEDLEKLQKTKDRLDKELDDHVERMAKQVEAGDLTEEVAADMIYSAIPEDDRRATKLEIEKRIKDHLDKKRADKK